ncbi:MAG TPA: Crp/Fnr family transcriptional regulator [Thermoanaerobaculia bacterium]|nr:Crp/Fnr family transcriptional regulator [Thermoanaerobaculia bacterium]
MTIEQAVEAHPIESTLLHNQTLEIWPAGRTLFYEGEEPRGVYVIHSGIVDLIFSAKDGRAKALNEGRPGQIIGLSSVFSHRPHDYTATVRTTSNLGFVDDATFHRLLENTPAMLFGVLRLLSEDVNSCYECMREIALAK